MFLKILLKHGLNMKIKILKKIIEVGYQELQEYIQKKRNN